jgi:uncharacterized protein
MKLFFDTSALVKFFHEEEGTQEVTALITAKDNEIWISELAQIEFLSALYRRVRNKEITDEQLTEAMSSFEEESASFNSEPLCHATIKEAEAVLKQYGKSHGLRTLDALQLSTFLLIAEKEWGFVGADKNLCEVVKAMEYISINPCIQSGKE